MHRTLAMGAWPNSQLDGVSTHEDVKKLNEAGAVTG